MKSRVSKKFMTMYRRLLERFGPQGWWPARTKTEMIIGAILTQNTSWQNVKKAIVNLRREKLLTFSALREVEHARLAQLIRPSGYFNMKAERLKYFTDFFYRQYRGSWQRFQSVPLPELREQVLSVNGVGPETADSILLYALDKPVFVIDAYTRRVLGRHGLIGPRDDYHAVQRLFMEHLEPDVPLFNEYHALFVRLATEHCLARPRCAGCPLRSVNGGPVLLETDRR